MKLVVHREEDDTRNKIKEDTTKIFEDIKHIDKFGNEYPANSVCYEIGKIVRKSIKEAGGTMLEDLPTPKTSLRELEKETKRIDKM